MKFDQLHRREFITLLGGAVGSMHLPRIARSQQAGQQKAAIVELIAPVVVSFVAILLTTLVLFMIDSYLARRTAGDG